MRQLFKVKYVHYENFFNEVLEPLFYHTLAIKRENDYSEFKCKIPFLNGGLFEPLDGYNWQETQIEIENEVFADLFDTFDEFNFTVKEDEPLDREVAVDPEMLGKVFENLLEVTDRKSAGAFYTPREIVHYMCQQSLINYLDERSSAPREDIRRFIEEGEVLLDQTIRDQEHKKTYSGKSWAEQEQLIPRSIEEFYEEIDELLRTIKVVDPAVGSGAFPIGMLNEIVRARSILSIYFERERNTAELKRECIENSLYGVDIMPSAVDICQLRFWLSLVVDELDRNDVHPLPNLDHKIKCGNSLLQEFEGVKLFDESLLGASTRRSTLERLSELQEQEQALAKQSVEGQISKEEYDRRSREIRKVHREIMRLARSENHSKQTTIEQAQNVKISRSIEMLREYKQLQRLFFREHDRENKRRLSNQIEELEWELIEETLGERDEDTSLQKLREIKKSKSKPFLLWKLYFSEVFQRQEPGFDIVIANPPYVSAWYMEKNNPGERDALRTQYADLGILKGHWDLYVAFIGLGYNILRPKGTLAYIVPSPLLKEKYAIEVRRFLLERTRLESLLPFAESNVFEGVSRRTVVFTAVKEVTNDDYQISVRNADIDRVDVVSEVRCANKSGWIADKRCVYMVTGDTETARLARKLDEVGSKLGNYFYVNIGAQLYSKKKGLFKRGHLIHHQKSAGRKPFFEGRDLQRWMIKSKDLWLDYRYNEIYGPRDPQLFETQKIVIRQITDRGHKLAAAVDSQGLYCDQSVLVAVPYRSLHGSNLRLAFKGYDHETDVPHLYYALAFLHSKVCTFYFRKRFSDDSLQGATSHAYPKSIRALPLPRASRALEAEIVRLAQLAESETVKGNLRGADRVAEELDSVFFEICEFNRQEINTILSYCQDPVS